jgi:hypothetical protein
LWRAEKLDFGKLYRPNQEGVYRQKAQVKLYLENALFTDAVLLSREADGVLLVARWGQTTKAALRATSDLLLQVNARMIGLVVNAYDLSAVPYDRAFRSEYYAKVSLRRFL